MSKITLPRPTVDWPESAELHQLVRDFMAKLPNETADDRLKRAEIFQELYQRIDRDFRALREELEHEIGSRAIESLCLEWLGC